MKNPWVKEDIIELGTEYNEKTNNDFSWVLPKDKEKFKIKKSNKSIAYGIPNVRIGIINNDDSTHGKAQVIQCLVNGRTRTITNNIRNLEEYIKQENSGNETNNGEYCKDPEGYYLKIINDKENIVVQELKDLRKSVYCKRNIRIQTVETRINAIADFFITKLIDSYNPEFENAKNIDGYTNFCDRIKNEGITFNVNLSRTFLTHSKEILKELIDRDGLDEDYTSIDLDDDISSNNNYLKEIENEILLCNKNIDYRKEDKKKRKGKYKELIFDDSFSDNVKNLAVNELAFRTLRNQLKNALNPLNEEYYLFHYYWHLFSTEKNRKDYFNNLISDLNKNLNKDLEKDELISRADKYNIANIEMIPYRSNDVSSIEYTEGNTAKDLESSKYVASLIVDRINDAKKDEKLYFIFRSFMGKKDKDGNIKTDGWKEIIKNYLEEIGQSKRYSELEEFFYANDSRNGVLTAGNIHKISGGKIEEKSISTDIYDNIIDAANLTNNQNDNK